MQIKEQDSIYDGQYISIILLQQIGDIMFVICKKMSRTVFLTRSIASPKEQNTVILYLQLTLLYIYCPK